MAGNGEGRRKRKLLPSGKKEPVDDRQGQINGIKKRKTLSTTAEEHEKDRAAEKEEPELVQFHDDDNYPFSQSELADLFTSTASPRALTPSPPQSPLSSSSRTPLRSPLSSPLPSFDDESAFTLSSLPSPPLSPQRISEEQSNADLIKPSTTWACLKSSSDKSQNLNKHITDVLEVVEKYHRSDGMKWNAMALRKAVTTLKKLPYSITSAQQALQIKGIGKGIATKIDEILRTGSLERIIQDNREDIISRFAEIWGAGPTSAKRWYDMGMRRLEDLIEAGDRCLNEQQRIGLRYYKEFRQKIPREEMKKHGKIIKTVARIVKSSHHVVLAGSYRRGRAECGDIDILISNPESKRTPIGVLHKIVSKLRKISYLTDDLEISEKDKKRDWQHHFDKYMGVACLPGGIHRRVDIIITPHINLPCTLMYFTGSDYFNRSTRLYAKKKGYYLCNHCICYCDARGKRVGEPIPGIRTEEDVFALLEIPYKTPSERDM